MTKVLTVIGARPQFIKASVVSRAFKEYPHIEEVIVHTGQHFDNNMSSVFFNELQIPTPKYLLNINGGNHGDMTARMLIELENIFLQERPDFLIVYGDTNSTLAGALGGAKLHVPVIHIEAGLRSYNKKMPEEINRVLTDHLSSILFCPTQIAVDNLINEGFNEKSNQIHLVGDVMQDAALHFSEYASIPSELDLKSNFILATLHRAENTDSRDRLEEIINALNFIHDSLLPIVLPLHPRTRKAIQQYNIKMDIKVINPLSYFEMLWCLKSCSLVLTDSGGTQKEAFFFNKPCVTMREETEWMELINSGVNVLSGAIQSNIIGAVNNMITKKIEFNSYLYGDGKASNKIAKLISQIG